MGKVSFKRGTSEQFASKVPNSDTIYFLTDTGEICLGDEVYSSMYDLATIDNKMTVGVVAKTDRYLDNTRILNPIWLNNMATIDVVPDKNTITTLYFYITFSSAYEYGNNFKDYLLYEKNGDHDPYEFTLDNAPVKYQYSYDSDAYRRKCKSYATNATSHVDLRVARAIYDSNDNLLDVIYSMQYRYVLDNNEWTVVRPTITPTSKNHIIEVGLYPLTTSNFYKNISGVYKLSDSNKNRIIPLNTVYQSDAFWSNVVDDKYFENATYGLLMVATDGQGINYMGPIVYKDTGDYDGTIYEIYDGSIEVTT